MTDSDNFISVNSPGYGTVEVNVDHIQMIRHDAKDHAILCFASGRELVTNDTVSDLFNLMDEQAPVPASEDSNGHTPDLFAVAEAYQATVNASNMTDSSKRAYTDHVRQFVRFARGEFEPGAWTKA